MTVREFLVAVRDYIEASEESVEAERGACRSFARMLEDGDVPDLYHEVVRLIAALGAE